MKLSPVSAVIVLLLVIFSSLSFANPSSEWDTKESAPISYELCGLEVSELNYYLFLSEFGNPNDYTEEECDTIYAWLESEESSSSYSSYLSGHNEEASDPFLKDNGNKPTPDPTLSREQRAEIAKHRKAIRGALTGNPPNFQGIINLYQFSLLDWLFDIDYERRMHFRRIAIQGEIIRLYLATTEKQFPKDRLKNFYRAWHPHVGRVDFRTQQQINIFMNRAIMQADRLPRAVK